MACALFGDWLSGQLSPAAQGGRARAFPWLPSVTHLDGPHASILLMGQARPVLAQGPEIHLPAMSHVSLAFTTRIRTAGSKGALPSRSRPVSFLKTGQVCVTDPVQTWEEGEHPSNLYSKKSKLQLQTDPCRRGGQAALRGVNRDGGLADDPRLPAHPRVGSTVAESDRGQEV